MSDERKVESEAADQVMNLLLELLAHGGWIKTSDLAARCGMHRDTARRHLRTLGARSWVRSELADGVELWILGPELPRIGVQFQELLVRRAAVVRADWERLQVPVDGGPK